MIQERKEGRKEAQTVPGRGEWSYRGVAFWITCFCLAFAQTEVAPADPLLGTWTTQYRGTIRVYLCVTRFQNELPQLDLDLVRANIRSALALWNTYPGVDYRLVWSGDRPGADATGCTDGSYPANGELTIRAQAEHPAAFASALFEPLPNITRAAIGFYRETGGNQNAWTFNHTEANTIDFDTVLMHELGHILGFPHDTSPYNSVMHPSLHYTMERVLWEEDITKLRDPNQTYHYNLRTNRQVLHKSSTDNGLNWSSEGNLQEFSNAKIGVAYNPAAGRHLVAWVAAEPYHRIYTILGDGINYFPQTRVAHSGNTTYYGVAAAYGQSRYVIAWTLTNDSRQIAYKHSQDGINWSNHQIVQYNGTYDYSSMWEPVLAYNANKNVFLLAWTNWQIAENDDSQGHVRICVNPNISGGVFGNCVEYYVVSNTPPALACHSTNNECILAWVNHIGYYDNHVSFRKGWVNNNNQFELYGTGYYFVTPSGTDLAPSLAFGNGYWLIAWRLKDGSSSSITLRMASNNWPNWGDVRTVDTLVQVSPTVHFAGAKFVHYYVRR